ncbi:unnamed protein product [Penicillium olsonii]|nr:unnamed protein product [Penicillium olsonii]
MHPAHNYRHSRRSACDRCRGQKLRCERVNINGMSCERCLKAQEVCITSVNHPATALSSNPSQDLVSNRHKSPGFLDRHDSMGLLHKPFTPTAVESVHPSTSARGMYYQKMHSYWDEPAELQTVPEGNFFLPPSEADFTIPLDTGSLPAPPQIWGDWNSHWPAGPYNYASGYPEGFIQDQMYEAPNVNAPALSEDLWWDENIYKEVPTGAPVEDQLLECTEPVPVATSRNVSDFDWSSHADITNVEDPLQQQTYHHRAPSQQDVRKALLKLKAELIHELDVLDDVSDNFIPSSYGPDSCGPALETLNLPIPRLLDHSSWLLEIVQSLRGVSDRPNERFGSLQTQSYRFEGSVTNHSDSSDNGSDEGATTTPSTDFEYQTTMTSPSHTTHTSYDITLWLSVLEAHCYLTRIYRAVFTRLYQLFLIIPPAEANGILLLPELRRGTVQLDGDLASQVQRLVEIGATMMGNIEAALGLCSGYNQVHGTGELKTAEAPHENNWSSSIRDCVFAQEQDPCEMPLVEIMKCLRQLVRATVVP